MIELKARDFKSVVSMLVADEFTSDSDKDWWEGVLYGLQYNVKRY